MINITLLIGKHSRLLLTLQVFKNQFVQTMANSRFEYVRKYEPSSDPIVLPECFAVIRIDGQNFHHFSKVHQYHKPNDKRALDLMVESGKAVMRNFYPAIKIAYGQSDEFSFIFSRSSSLYNRRQNKLISLVVSKFSSAFVFNWSKYFLDVQLIYPPSFDARCVLYPNKEVLIDYLKWRQVDCHINNLYNTVFHLITGQYINYSFDDEGKIVLTPLKSDLPAKTPQEAVSDLRGTLKKDKHDIMFDNYKINYNNELEQFKKGSLLILDKDQATCKTKIDQNDVKIIGLNIDVIKSEFWEENDYLLE